MLHTDEYEYLFHEIKNDICLVAGSVQLITGQHPEVCQFRYWDELVKDLSHLLNMCRETPAFEQHISLHPELLDPSEFFREIQETIPALLNKRTTCIFVVDKTLPQLLLDPIQMRHAMINLIKNSAEAIEEAMSSDSAVGEITVSVRASNTPASGILAKTDTTAFAETSFADTAFAKTTFADAAFADAAFAKTAFADAAFTKTAFADAASTTAVASSNFMQSTVGNPGNIQIQVQDNGCGITPEELKKIFLPSYTTKSGGSGLGLGITRRIVEAHGGTIRCESRLGLGTTFTIEIPFLRKQRR